MVSMKDIARRCGVSVATVSKALNGLPDVGEATRSHILAMAREMGYLTNVAARALKTNRTYNLGVLMADEQRNGLQHEYFTAVLESFRTEAARQGYDTTFLNRSMGGQPTSYLQHCRCRGLDGVVIACIDFGSPWVRELLDSGLPLVTLDRVFENHLSVVSDNASGVAELVRYVHGMGHRKLAFLHGESTPVTESRLTGFRQTCQELGITVPESCIIPCVYHDPHRCAEATRQLLSLPDRPTCILFPDDYSYLGGVQELMRAGLRIPQDISVVGYDGIHLAHVLGLTTFSQNADALGRTAAARLIALIENPRTAPRDRVLIQGRLLEGHTVKRL